MDEALDAGSLGGVQQDRERLDVEPPEFIERSPVADLGGAVEDPIGARDTGFQGGGIFQVADDGLHAPLCEPASITCGPDQGSDAMAPPEPAFFGRVTADQSGRAGDEDRFHRLMSIPWHFLGSSGFCSDGSSKYVTPSNMNIRVRWRRLHDLCPLPFGAACHRSNDHRTASP